METNGTTDPLLNKDGSTSKVRVHRGNIPTLPQTKACPHCSARFTTSAHLTRHVKSHTNERLHKCSTCDAQFTRGDLLARHRKICQDPNRPNRLKPCLSCIKSKVKCDRNDPCSRCKTKGGKCARKPTDSSHASAPSESSAISNPTAEVLTANNTSFLTADSLSEELADLTPPSESLVHSHLSSIYENDVFQPLFSDVFSPVASSTLDEPPLSLPSIQRIPRTVSLPQPWLKELLAFSRGSHPKDVNLRQVELQSLLDDFFSCELDAAEPQHYCYLFFNPFLVQMPILHVPTADLIGKPLYLMKSMKSCGALFVKTKKANDFIISALADVREELAHAFDRALTERLDQVHLVIAVVLLQTIGLFHQNPNERAMSNLYHEYVVLMIRRAGLMSYNSSWTPVASSTETMWRDWVHYETTKRALLLSYLHDCWQSIFFGLPPAYVTSEMILRLPCEEALWKAQTAEEWLSVLQTPVGAQSSHSRLTGQDYTTTWLPMVQVDPNFVPVPNLGPFAHLILIHVILRDLFNTCTETTRLAQGDRSGSDEDNPALMASKYALHHWLYSWRTNRPQSRNAMEEPPWVENALPLYWLGHVAILAHQEGFPPFDSTQSARGEARYKLVKRWLKRIRSFLSEGDGESTLFWDELMKIQLQTWQLEYDTDGGADDQEGLLAFFPEI